MKTADGSHSATDIGEQLRRELFQAREVNAGHYIHAVLDPNHPVAPYDLLHPEHLGQRIPSVKIHRVDRADLKHDKDLCPLVVTLFTPGDRGYRDEALLQEMIDNAVARCASVNGAYVCGWAATANNGEELAKLIAASTVMSHPLIGRRVLPWFEPHRLALLVDRHPAVVWQRISGISSWWFVDMSGQLKKAAPPSGSSHEGPDDLPAMSLKQVQAVWADQERVHEARLVAMALRKAGISLPASPEVVINNAVRLAHERELYGEQDVVFFAMNSLTLSAEWFEHPVVQAALRTLASSDELTLADILASQPDAVLEEIALYKTQGREPT